MFTNRLLPHPRIMITLYHKVVICNLSSTLVEIDETTKKNNCNAILFKTNANFPFMHHKTIALPQTVSGLCILSSNQTLSIISSRELPG